MTRTFQTAEDRWAGVGPYYAMFPVGFADTVIKTHSEPGDLVLDPFAGRGTSLFSASRHGRVALGVEINPVGWVYGRAKLKPAAQDHVTRRLYEVSAFSRDLPDGAEDELPTFFHLCFSARVRRFLLAARKTLNWRERKTDWTLAALLCVYLHGKREAALSNQMRQTKAMSPDYAIRWWRDRNLEPPDVDPVAFMEQRIRWRYSRGLPTCAASSLLLGDSREKLTYLKRAKQVREGERAALLFTSPPYRKVTNYFYDQWIRHWLLGGAPNALRPGGEARGKFEGADLYHDLLLSVFKACVPLLRQDAVVYVRTSSRRETLEPTRKVLSEIFPDKAVQDFDRPFDRPTQTRLFGDAEPKAGEVDLVLQPA